MEGGGWTGGKRLQFKIVVGHYVKPKNQPEGVVLAP